MTSRELAQAIRADALRMTAATKASHIGSCLSIADILAVLYANVLRVRPNEPAWPARDRLVVSKGHAAAIVYAVLARKGFFAVEELSSYTHDGSIFTGHVSHHVPGVEFSTGSLGHGLPVGTGMALAASRMDADHRTFVLLSDGELDEGSNWEAILFAGHHKLRNLTAIVDANGIQSFGSVSEVLELEPLPDKFRNFGWLVREIDGHDHDALLAAFEPTSSDETRPVLVLARTVKGAGVSFMENELRWHYRSANPQELADALAEVGAAS
ncbi:MAG: transketolase [Phycisphaerae bacterium]|nr:transketolase [Gemmatimonadaceae bacterium]